MVMTKREQIELAITAFVKGGDNSDVNLLETVLHDDFRVMSTRFMGMPDTIIIDKKKYISNIRDGVFGGLPRKMKIERIDDLGTIANVSLWMESSENQFLSFNSLVLDVDNRWKIISNLAVVEAKKNDKVH